MPRATVHARKLIDSRVVVGHWPGGVANHSDVLKRQPRSDVRG